ncbi:MAG: GIY-YIG nuclease family protein [Cyanothece sp. SIO1E1]|nr:GIY-YIG nuclease family protein [Cyanothece sp. SIO1E1]
MTTETSTPSLVSLDYIPYLDENGQIPIHAAGKVGVYAIFDQDQILQHIGYSRDVYLSLKQHLVRKPQLCYWWKFQTINRPSRTVLEAMRDAWIAENGSTPIGNGPDADAWNQPIDAKLTMTEADKTAYEQTDELGQMKLLKKIARRVESEVKAALASRGVQMDLRFNPKLKENGLLDLK